MAVLQSFIRVYSFVCGVVTHYIFKSLPSFLSHTSCPERAESEQLSFLIPQTQSHLPAHTMEELGSTSVVATMVDYQLPVAGDTAKNTSDMEEDQRHSETEDDSTSEEGSDTGDDDGCSVGEEVKGLSSPLAEETGPNSGQSEADTDMEELEKTCKSVPRKTLRDAVNESAHEG